MSVDVAIVFGTRPEIIRFAPIIHKLKKEKFLNIQIIYTGQHYSPEMKDVFFNELGLDNPDHSLTLVSAQPEKQIAEVIDKSSTLFDTIKPMLVCVWGDTNSSLGAGLAANKMRLKLVHIEAGCRSADFNMAEEYNRIILDHIADVLIPLSTHDKENLEKEHVHGTVHQTGDPLYDIFLEKKRTLSRKGLINIFKKKKYVGLLTLHRAENVDSREILSKILGNISSSLRKSKNCNIIFPIHPRTKKMVDTYNLNDLIDNNFISTIDPLGYDEIMELLLDADFAITDSGGFQKEAFFAKKPCITLRKSTEWVDTVRLGVNLLQNPATFSTLPNLDKFVDTVSTNFELIKEIPYGNGQATEKIVRHIISLVR